MQQIVEKVTEVERVSEGLKNVYIMTNAPIPWVKELKTALGKAHRWDHIASSRDLKLSWDQKYVAQTVDMMIGQRAQVFIGNGVCFLLMCLKALTLIFHVSVLEFNIKYCYAAHGQRRSTRK